ncbi:MAG: hypothetical protein E7480_02920 [Ruminococcaceae bacterium]|nr:hypothetical protein [Oscillospiraceae bacterium]
MKKVLFYALTLILPVVVLISGMKIQTLKNIVLNGFYCNLPGAWLTGNISKAPLPKVLAESAFSLLRFYEEAESFTYAQQSFSQPYFKKYDDQKTELPVSVVTLKPSSSDGYLIYNDVLIKDNSTKKPDIKAIFERKLDLGLKASEQGPQVLILHTHATESFNLSGAEKYDAAASFRSEDTSENVVAVGAVLAQELEKNGIGVIHSTVLHDSESYSGAYGRSLKTAEEILKKNPTIKVVLDVHRDSLIAQNKTKYRPIIEKDGITMAQVMIVIGTGTASLPNDNWKNNLRLAVSLQGRLDKSCSGLTRPIMLRDSRYNMHLSKGYLLLEIGSCGNTLEETKRSAVLIGKALSEEIKERCEK